MQTAMKKPAFLLLACFTFTGLFGQDTQVHTFGLSVVSVVKSDRKSFVATLGQGTNIGLETGQEVSVWGILRPDEKGHNQKIGTGKIKQVSAEQATVEGVLLDQPLFAGDLVYVSLTVPAVEHSPYFYLMANNTTVVNEQGQPFYTLAEILDRDGLKLRTEKFLAMQREIQAAGNNLKKSGDQTKVTAGPHAGEPVWQVMSQTDTLAVWYYVYHLSQIWEETMGQTIRLVDGYRAYVTEGDVISDDLLKSFLVEGTPQKRDKLFAQYSRRINRDLTERWKQDAKGLKADEKYLDAANLLEVCTFLAEKLGNPDDAGVYCYQMAESFESGSEYDKAREGYLKAADYFQKQKDDNFLGFAYNALGAVFQKQKEYEQSLNWYAKATTVRTELVKKDPNNVDYLNNLFTTCDWAASATLDMQDYESSKQLYAAGLEVARKAKNRSNEASALWNLGFATEKSGDRNEAIRKYGESMTIYLELHDTASALTLSKNIAINYKRLDNFSKAQAEALHGLQLAKSWGKPAKVASQVDYQGELYYDAGDYANCIKKYLEAEELYKKNKDNASLENLKKRLGKAYRDAKQYDVAVAKHRERLALVDKDDFPGQADIYWDIAFTFGAKGDPKAEVQNYREAEKLYTAAHDTANLTIVINNIGYSYRDGKDSLKAYREHLKAIELNKNRGDKKDLAYSYEHLAESYKYFESHERAAENFALAAVYYERTEDFKKAGGMLDGEGNALSNLGKYEESADAFKKAIALYKRSGDKKEEAEAYWDYAYQIGQNLRQHKDAIKNYEIAYGLYMEAQDSVHASTMLSNIGQNYWSLLDYDKAIESHKAAIALAEKCNNKEQIASSWSKLATLFKESNNPIESNNALQKAVVALTAIKDSTQLAEKYDDLGNSYVKSKDFTHAFECFDKSIALYKARKDTSNWAYVLNDLASACHTRNDFKNAEKNYLLSLQLRKKIGDKDGQVYALAGLGNLEQNVNTNYKKAEEYFLQAITLGKETGNDNILAFVYGQMKWLYRAEGKSKLADEYMQKSVDAYRKTKNWVQMANAIAAQSYDVSYVYGDQKKALRLLNNAQAMADTLNDLSLQAYIYGQRGTIMREMGEFQTALEFADKSFELYKKIDNEWGMAGVYIDRGNIYKQISEYTLALENQKKADSLYVKMHSDYARLAPLANIGENYTAQGDYLKGLEYYQQSLAIMEKAGDLNENLAIIQGLMGESYFYLEQFGEADVWLKRALETSDKVGAMRPKADNLGVMGRLKIEEKKYDEAFGYLSEGLKLSKEKSMNIAYLNNLVLLGKLEVERKNYPAGKTQLEECIKLSREMNKQGTLWEGLYWMGMLHKNSNQIEQSTDFFKEAVSVIENIRNKVSGGEEAKKMFSKDKNILKVYEALVEVLLQQGKTEEAMSYIQKNNEENLKAKVKNLDVKFEDKDKQKAIVQERGMKAKLDGIEQQIAMEKSMPLEKQNLEKLRNLEGIKTVAESDYLKFINMQVNLKPELSSYFNSSIKPAELKGKKKNIPKDMALLSYMPGETQLYIFVATTDTVIAKVVNVTREQLGKNINAMLNIVRTMQGNFQQLDLTNEDAKRREIVPEVKQTDRNMRPFDEMYHYLIAPASVEIANKKRLCIIPNGALSYVPFQLLGKTLTSGRFCLLAEQFSIFYSSSIDMLLRPAEPDAKQFSILAFGNPDRTLPATEKEVADIKKMYPSASVFLREEATEEKAKHAGENYNVMHFATHGNLDYEDFSKSYLTLAPGKTEDGMLTLEELWGMDVMSHLNIVVLSACQTAVTKGSNESSPVSPASGFLQNGVKSVVATLWKVDDEATSLLITDFYNNLKTMDAVDALRQAQLKLSANPKFSHPYFWAAAILLGDWR